MTKHESYDEKCDMFAMGCLMYDLYARQLRHVSLFQNAGTCTVDAHVLGQYAVKVGLSQYLDTLNLRLQFLSWPTSVGLGHSWKSSLDQGLL